MTNDALHTLLPIAGWLEERARAVEITGGTDPILPTPFRIGETSAAALAAIGLAVSDLWALRTGRWLVGRGQVPEAELTDETSLPVSKAAKSQMTGVKSPLCEGPGAAVYRRSHFGV